MATTAPATPKRYPLGLPPGSVRAILALGTQALLWAMTVFEVRKGGDVVMPLLFVYLLFLMLFVLAHYFGSHGKSIGRHLDSGSALGLPAGTVRLVLIASAIGLAVYLYLHPPKGIMPTAPDTPKQIAFMLTVLLGAYVVGGVLSGAARALGGGETPYWFQDIHAWFALLALVVLTILMLLYFNNAHVATENQVPLDHVEAVLTGLVGLYFGSRA
jgi:hypothetical protein